MKVEKSELLLRTLCRRTRKDIRELRLDKNIYVSFTENTEYSKRTWFFDHSYTSHNLIEVHNK